VEIGDLVTFCPEAWGTPLQDRPLGVVTDVQPRGVTPETEMYEMVTAIFPGDDIPYSSRIEDFEVVNEDW
jgi:hypothetical protein